MQNDQSGIVLVQTADAGATLQHALNALATAGLRLAPEGRVFTVNHAMGRFSLDPAPRADDSVGDWTDMIGRHPDPAAVARALNGPASGFELSLSNAPDPELAARLIRDLLGVLAVKLPGARIVILPGEGRVALASELAARPPRPAATPAAPASASPAAAAPVAAATAAAPTDAAPPTDATASAPRAEGFLLYTGVPANLAAALNLTRDPALAQLPFGVPFAFKVGESQVRSRSGVGPFREAAAFAEDLRLSPMRSTLQPVAARQASWVKVSVVGPDIRTSMALLVQALVAGMSANPGGAVWLPDQRRVTTDVLYTHDADTRPLRAQFGVHAGVIDEGTSFASTEGLWVFGGTDLFAELPLPPAEALDGLGNAAASTLAAGGVPAEGHTMIISGTAYRLERGIDTLGRGNVLRLVPILPASPDPTRPAEEEPANQKKGFFGRLFG